LGESVKVYNLDSGQCTKTLIRNGKTTKADKTGRKYRTDLNYTAVSIFILNETQIVYGKTDNTITIWDLSTVRCLKVISGHTYSVQKVIKISKTKIVSASKDKFNY